MEGPPFQSTSHPDVDVNDARVDAVWNGELEDFGCDKSFVIDAADLKDSDDANKAKLDDGGTTFNAFCLKSLDEIEADAAANAHGIYDFSRNGNAVDDAEHGKAVKAHGKGMDFSYVKSVSCFNDVSMDMVAFGKAKYANAKADNINGIYMNIDKAYDDAVIVGSLTGDDVLNVFDDDEEQGHGDNIPVDGNHRDPPNILSIEAQAQQHVDDAIAVFQQLKDAVADANDMLQSMKKPAQRISANLMSELEVSLTDTPGWFLQVIDGKERQIAALQQQLDEVWEQHNDIAAERDELQLKLDGEPKPMGLSAGDLKKLRNLGVDNFNDLIRNYRQLQIEIAVASGKQPGSKATTRDTVSMLPAKDDCRMKHQLQPNVLQQGGISSSFSKVGATGNSSKEHIPIPMPDKFEGKSRVELERYFRYFDQAVTARGYGDKDKAVMVGNYVPTLQFVHDKLFRKNCTYAEIKAGLLNSLGTDSSVATFTLRTSLDRITKSDEMLYKDLLEDIERQVTQAFNDDNDQGDAELKKILIRLTQEDSNPIFGSTIIPHLNEEYTRLKELVLGVEEALIIKNKAGLELHSNLNKSSSYEKEHYPKYQTRYDSPRSYPAGDNRFCDGHQRDADKIIVQSNRTKVERYNPSLLAPSNTPLNCWRCKNPSHYANDCPEPREQGTREVKGIDDVGMNGIISVDNIAEIEEDLPLFGKKPMLDVYLDGVKVSAMLDSGACASVISETAIAKILRQRPKGVRQIFEEDPRSFLHKRLISANGTALTVINCLRMPISCGSYPPKIVKFFVVPELQQGVLVGTNVLQHDACWIEALGIALNGDSSNSGYCNEKVKNGIGVVVPQNMIVDDTTRDKFNIVRENVKIVPCFCKTFIVSDDMNEAQHCSKKTDTVAQDETQLQIKKRRKRCRRHARYPKEPLKEKNRAIVLKDNAFQNAYCNDAGKTSTHAITNINGMESSEPADRVHYVKRRTFYNSNYVLARGSSDILGVQDVYKNTHGFIKSSADADPDWRNRHRVSGVKTIQENPPSRRADQSNRRHVKEQ